MSEDENFTPESDDYEVMLQLDRLESLREDLLDHSLNSLSGLEAALALLVPASAEAEERRSELQEIRNEMLELHLDNLAEIDARIEQLNQQLDEDEEEEDAD